jgi:hypothetical protein
MYAAVGDGREKGKNDPEKNEETTKDEGEEERRHTIKNRAPTFGYS